MKLVWIFIILNFMFFNDPCKCQGEIPEFPFAFRPIPTGPVALSLGGTSISNLDDPLLAIQNPALLSMISKSQFTISIYSAVHKEISNIDHDNYHGEDSRNIEEFRFNYVGLSWPFQLFSMKMGAAISYYPAFTFDRLVVLNQQDNNALTDNRRWEFSQKGYMSATSLSYGIKLFPQCSLGVSWNLWLDDLFDNHWEQTTMMNGIRQNGQVHFVEFHKKLQSHEISGSNFTLGIVWDISKHLHVGAIVKTRQSNEITSHTVQQYGFKQNQPNVDPIISGVNNFQIPMKWGIGVSYSFFDNCTALMDFQQINWGKLHYRQAQNTSHFISGHQEDIYQDLRVHLINLGTVFRSNHKIGPFAPVFRMGFLMCTDRGSVHPEPDSAIGFGLGLKGKRLDFNIGFQYQKYMDLSQQVMQDGLLINSIRNNVIEFSVTLK